LEDDIENSILYPSYVKLLGIPYKKLDCWGVAREFYRLELGIDLKRYYDQAPNDNQVAKNLIYTNAGDFEAVTKPTFGNIVLINLNGIEAHIGIYLNEQQFLHTTIHSGCVVDRIAKWEKMFVGYYRVKNI